MNKIILGNNSRFLMVLVVLYFVNLIFSGATFNNSLKRNNKMIPSRKKSVIELLFTTNASIFDLELETGKYLCRWLKGLKYQRKICQKLKGLPLILQQTRILALESCQRQFQYEQWNCSSTHMKKFFRKSYRETAFMYSLASSALGYVLAQACVEGKLANCKCTTQLQSNDPIEEWGGCSVNTKFASRFVDKFLRLKDKLGDNPSDIMKYNSRVGLKIMQNKTEKYCKCHGVSGSCTQKICWIRVKPFITIAENLKKLYHNAIKVESDNTVHNIRGRKKMKQLIYLDPTPNFCDSRKNFVTVSGRQCKDIDNCATLCCSNNYKVSIKKVPEKCHCNWLKNDTGKYQTRLKCDDCFREELLYHCT